MSLLEIDGLGVSIGTTEVLRDVSLRLEAGEILGLVGESGSGKSMTALAVMGLLPEGAYSTGSVRLAGREITTLAERELCRLRGAGVGMIFQEPMTALNPLMTIGDQVAETLIVHRGLARSEARRIARDRLDRVGLPAPRFPLTLFPHELSGGQRQRVAIALAIALRPQLLIADEPTTALDVTTQAEVLALLRDLVRAEGMALLLITHDLAVTAQMAARVAVMQGGRIVEEGPTEALFRAPARPYTRALLAAACLAPPAREYLDQEKATRAFSWQKYSKPDADALLRVEDARRSYRLPRPAFFAPAAELHAVDGVSFTLHAGESLGLVGESGCGKSTLTRAILGLDPLSGGRITLAGAPVSPRMPPAQRAAVQVVFQDPYGSFDPRQTVARLIAEPFHLTGRPPDAEARIDAALSDVGLSPEDRDRYIHEFSGGQRQRLAIARALIIRPRLIVLDEAVSALDVRVRAQVLALLARLQAEHGLSYLFISHDLSVVRAVTTRCLVMQAGRIVEEGPTEDLFTAPRHPYTRRLLAATPRLPETWRTLDPAPPTGA